MEDELFSPIFQRKRLPCHALVALREFLNNCSKILDWCFFFEKYKKTRPYFFGLVKPQIFTENLLLQFTLANESIY